MSEIPKIIEAIIHLENTIGQLLIKDKCCVQVQRVYKVYKF